MLGKNVYLHHDIKKYLTAKQPVFDQMMALRGECFRHLQGRKTQRITLGGKSYFIKQHTGVGWIEIIKNMLQFRWPVLSAKNEWKAIQQLQTLGVAVPVVTAYGQRGVNPGRLESFILMEELAPVISLEDLTKTWRQLPPTFALKRKLLEEVARIARLLHQNGLNHRDFYLCHFLLDTAPGLENIRAPSVRLFLIDLHRAQIRRLTPLRWIVKDLAGLYFSSKDIGLTQRDLYRFMKVYAAKTLQEIGELDRAFWQKVKARGEKLYLDHTR
jgi:heptose I phosphotransferase